MVLDNVGSVVGSGWCYVGGVVMSVFIVKVVVGRISIRDFEWLYRKENGCLRHKYGHVLKGMLHCLSVYPYPVGGVFFFFFNILNIKRN